MAYVLGYFAADGCMQKNKRGAHFIEFKSTDKELLEKVWDLLGSSHKISTREFSRELHPSWNKFYRLQFGSKDMYNDLVNLGFTPAKSKLLKFPNIPIQYFSHFARGYFDGDGHVSISSFKRNDRGGRKSTTIISGFTSGSKEFLSRMHSGLKRYANVSGGSLYAHAGYRLTFSVKDTKKLYNFFYTGASGVYLSRKRKIFENYFNIGEGT